MRKKIEYLSDEELDRLVEEIELQEMMAAPPDLKEQILESIAQEEGMVSARERKCSSEKIAEYKRFRFRVLTTVAAAVLMVFLLPQTEIPQLQDIHLKNTIFGQKPAMEDPYQSREGMLSDSSVMEAILGGINIFGDNNKWNLFKD